METEIEQNRSAEQTTDSPGVIEIDNRGRVVIHLQWQACLKVAVVLLLTIGSYFLPLPGLTEGSRICLAIFVGAAGLWVTEAIPPFATATMVIVLSIYLLGSPGGPLGFDEVSMDHSYRIFLNPIASPVLVLFFGGFILARAAAKHGFDVRLARAFLKPFGTNPKMVLLGVILITALFSMFMSNTATAAMMIAVLTPLCSHFEGRDPFKKALVLAVPFAANIGGIGTIIGTPPNAVAASVLGEIDHPVSFLSWMMVGVPLAAITLLALWVILITVFKPRQESFSVLFPNNLKVTWGLVIVVSTFAATVGLWLTQPLHDIPSGVVALLPILVFTVFKVIDREDLKRIEWNVLILIAVVGGVGIAFACSLAMSLPISTPPNAIAFATHLVTTRDMAKYGSLVSVVGLVLLVIALLLINAIGGIS